MQGTSPGLVFSKLVKHESLLGCIQNTCSSKFMQFAETWMDPETVVQNEVSTKLITYMWKLEK